MKGGSTQHSVKEKKKVEGWRSTGNSVFSSHHVRDGPCIWKGSSECFSSECSEEVSHIILNKL